MSYKHPLFRMKKAGLKRPALLPVNTERTTVRHKAPLAKSSQVADARPLDEVQALKITQGQNQSASLLGRESASLSFDSSKGALQGQSWLSVRAGQVAVPSSKPVRVKAPGEQLLAFEHLSVRDNIPQKYTNDARFDSLSADPAHGDEQTATSLREAMSGLESEALGHLQPPITRGPAEIEFYDGQGRPYDVKTPRSPASDARWSFNPRKAARSIIKQLDKSHDNALTQKQEPVSVILDSTYLSREDHAQLWSELESKLNAQQLKRIIEVNVEVA